MNNFADFTTRRRFTLGFIILSLFAAAVFLPLAFRSAAGNDDDKIGKGTSKQTTSREEGLENYDIRTDKSEYETLANFRNAAGKSAVEVADARDGFAAGEKFLKQRVPTLKVEYNSDLRVPEVIASNVKLGRAFLTNRSEVGRADTLRGFVKQNNDLLGVSDAQADALEVVADYTNPDGNLSFAQFEQKIYGVPVFRGEVKAAFTKKGEMIRVINNLAPSLNYAALANDFGNPAEAVKSAARYINYELKDADAKPNEATSNDLKTVFGAGDWATTAEKMYFPTEPGVARAAWRVLIWKPVNAYYVIVDAETGKMLWRKNITDDQTQAATFSVYANPNAMINVADSPFPLTPGSTNPNLNIQGQPLNRTLITRVGNEFPYTFNNNGWITDGFNQTDGNAIEAGIDRDGTDGVDPQGKATANGTRQFVYNYAPGNPNTNTGDAPNPATQTYPISEYQKGAVTQLFYISNWYHDETYRLGFTEQAFNFQADNFGRGGFGGDRVSGEAQDSSGTNNANFGTPADGARGKMQMYLWTGPTPDFDGDLDADIVIHEFTHGLSNRLHGNSSGLSTNMARAMGEGWSDFYAHALLSEPSDPINGIYTTGAYATYLSGGRTSNYYYGIRRFPKAVMSFVGPNGKPHNPLSFRHVNPDCNNEIGSSGAIGTISAYPRGPSGSTTCDQTHAAGEIWSSALWEVRARMIVRLGWEIGNRRTLQLVTDGMKLAPLSPTFLQERDAIIAAAQASGAAADVADIWEGFRIRGMGFSADINSIGSGAGNANVIEAFDAPNLVQTPTLTVNDASGNNNGFADPGETVLLSVPLTNNTGVTAAKTTVKIGRGAAVSYGAIQNNQTASREISYRVPAGATCGRATPIKLNINSSLGAKIEYRTLVVGKPLAGVGFAENFDNVTAPNVPNGWNAPAPNPSTGSTLPWQTVSINPSSAPNAAFAPDPGNVYLAQLESPAVPITVSAARLRFRINYDTEPGWDGTTLDVKIGAGAYQDVIAAGGKFVSGGYPILLSPGSAPNAGRRAWSGKSNGYVDVDVILPATANGQTVQFRWNASADGAVAGVGTYIDNVEVISDYACALPLTDNGDK